MMLLSNALPAKVRIKIGDCLEKASQEDYPHSDIIYRGRILKSNLTDYCPADFRKLSLIQNGQLRIDPDESVMIRFGDSRLIS